MHYYRSYMYLAYIETDVPSRNQSSISVGNYKRLLMLTCKMSVHVCMQKC